MAKKEAHAQALKMFIKSKGKTTLKAIADAVGVSPFTVGSWHKTENWKGKIEPIKAALTGKGRRGVESIVIRKKALVDQAVKIFRESGGKISNVKLRKQLKVAKGTLRKWKRMPQWSQAAAVTISPKPVEVAPSPQVAPPPQMAAPSIDSITSLQNLVALNERLRSMLERHFLTAAEIEHLSNAKLSLLEAAEVYLGIVKG